MGDVNAASKTHHLMEPVRHRLTVGDYKAMVEHGILGKYDRVELIEGEILDKMTIGQRHTAGVARLLRLFAPLALQNRCTMVSPSSLELPPSSMPEPDVMLLAYRADFYASRYPLSRDVVLLVEVSESSLKFDRSRKRRLYAAAGVREYWIVNLIKNVVEVHTNPIDGDYTDVRIAARKESLEPTAFPGFSIAVADVIP